MLKTGIHIHASLFGFPNSAYEEMRDDLSALEEVEYAGGTLRVWHSGPLLDPGDLFSRLVRALGREARGGMDVIDYDEWTMTRYTYQGGEIRSRTIPLNEALESKCSDWGA